MLNVRTSVFLPRCIILIVFCSLVKFSVGQQPAASQPNSAKYIYFTFDDGPLYGSDGVNRVIKEEQIKTNVFIVGQHAFNSKAMMDFYKGYLANPLIEVGNHSFTHANDHYTAFYSNPDSVLRDFLKCQHSLNIPYKFARQPGRNQWRLPTVRKDDLASGAESADLLYKNGYKVYGWDLEWQHNGRTGSPLQSVDGMLAGVEKLFSANKTVKPGHLIILAHDEMFRKPGDEAKLKTLIQKLKAKGYRFEHLSNYPG
ncbi:polysaccharide deacetylase family protein [Danxiaibacter flavus]|uniref:Polysaccharide deacetylase family protein n=1 Tax=Danxiaibacter flavus TaxID=3049108 RepID=A0ABV3ZM86_9BACT|nr:polysaccharide deacetylase family protein [Chitinophagaceae bacterium DXS]